MTVPVCDAAGRDDVDEALSFAGSHVSRLGEVATRRQSTLRRRGHRRDAHGPALLVSEAGGAVLPLDDAPSAAPAGAC